MSLGKQIVSDLTASMKAQDASRTSTLRMVKAAIMNRQIEKGSELNDDDVQKLLRSLVKQRRDSIEQYEKAGRAELVAKEQAEIDIIETYLPQAASKEEIEQAVAAAIAETGASSMKDMGKVMKAAQTALAGKNADGRLVSEVVKSRLTRIRSRLLEPSPLRIIHSLLEGTGSRPVGFAPTFSFVREPSKRDNGKRVDCSQGSGIS